MSRFAIVLEVVVAVPSLTCPRVKAVTPAIVPAVSVPVMLTESLICISDESFELIAFTSMVLALNTPEMFKESPICIAVESDDSIKFTDKFPPTVKSAVVVSPPDITMPPSTVTLPVPDVLKISASFERVPCIRLSPISIPSNSITPVPDAVSFRLALV